MFRLIPTPAGFSSTEDSQAESKAAARPSVIFQVASAPAVGGRQQTRQPRDGSLPLSGSEPEFREVVDPTILGASSSYSYALGDVRVGRDPPQPGERGGFSLQRQCRSMEHACKLFGKAMMADNPMRVYPIAAERPCQQGYYKVMLFTGKNRHQPAQDGGASSTTASTSASAASASSGLSDPGQQKRDQVVLEGLYFRQHKGVHYSVEEDTPVRALARWFGVQPQDICNHNPGLKLNKGSKIPAGAEVHVPDVNCWSYQLDAGFTPVITDTDGALVKDPRKAARKFGVLGSSDGVGVEYGVRFGSYCGAYCVQSEHVRTGGT